MGSLVITSDEESNDEESGDTSIPSIDQSLLILDETF